MNARMLRIQLHLPLMQKAGVMGWYHTQSVKDRDRQSVRLPKHFFLSGNGAWTPGLMRTRKQYGIPFYAQCQYFSRFGQITLNLLLFRANIQQSQEPIKLNLEYAEKWFALLHSAISLLKHVCIRSMWSNGWHLRRHLSLI